MSYTGLVKQLDQTAVPCPLSLGPNRAPVHIDGDMEYMSLFREETTIAEVTLMSRDSWEVEAWYFRCMKCNLILPANRGMRF